MSIFDKREKRKIEQSVFRPAFRYDGSFYPGWIYPVFCKKVMPGDTWHIASAPFFETQPCQTPFFTPLRCDIRYFYVRNMLAWPNFDQYITGKQRYSAEPSTVVHPYFKDFKLDGAIEQRKAFWDYLYGCVDDSNNTIYRGIDPLPARMYNMIYNEYYMSEFIQDPAPVRLTDGVEEPLTQGVYYIRRSDYRKDYFTSALPYPQFGDGVALPAEVIYKPNTAWQRLVTKSGADFNPSINPVAGGGNVDYVYQPLDTDEATKFSGRADDSTGTGNFNVDPNGTLGVNVDIRDLRLANAIQKFLERSALNGNRYAEYILAHFGVRTADNSMFRPQYLGGGYTYVNMSSVQQNSQTEDTPQGTQAGIGRLRGVVGMNHKYFFTEHGWIMAIMCIRPDAMYAGGLQKQFRVTGDRFEDYVIPEMQNIGMEEIKNYELAYLSGNGVYNSENDGTFGYTERYMSYKSFPNEVHGELLRSLSSWEITRNFVGQSNAPALNQTFLAVNENCMAGVMAVDGYPPFVGYIHHDVRVKRPLQFKARYTL